jgi:hypothetical protein
MSFQELRRAVAASGLQVATAHPPRSQGRTEAAVTREATLVEDEHVRQRAVGSPTPCPEPLAFLDGIQRYQVVGYGSTEPIVGAVIAAAVRERVSGHLTTVAERREHLVVGRRTAVAGFEVPSGHRVIALPEDEHAHPIRDLDVAVAAIDRARNALELRVAEVFRQRSDGWLIVDGSLAESPTWASDPRMIGITKSHATLPFAGSDLVQYLRLPQGHRSSVYQPEPRRVAPVYAWGLRLWPWEGRDLLFGFVRVERAPIAETLEGADEVSRWILAERAPISSGDARWDRLLYGIHSVEEYLRASLPAS